MSVITLLLWCTTSVSLFIIAAHISVIRSWFHILTNENCSQLRHQSVYRMTELRTDYDQCDVVWDVGLRKRPVWAQKIGLGLGLAGFCCVVKHNLVTLVVIISEDTAAFQVLSSSCLVHVTIWLNYRTNAVPWLSVHRLFTVLMLYEILASCWTVRCPCSDTSARLPA